METYTPQILWHGGANERGKPDPVYTLDLHPTEALLATGGIDDGMPAKGTARVSHSFVKKDCTVTINSS